MELCLDWTVLVIIIVLYTYWLWIVCLWVNLELCPCGQVMGKSSCGDKFFGCSMMMIILLENGKWPILMFMFNWYLLALLWFGSLMVVVFAYCLYIVTMALKALYDEFEVLSC